MTIMGAYFTGLLVMCAAGTVTWLMSLKKRDVSIVDSLWSVFFVLGALAYSATIDNPGVRTGIVLFLVSVWALRLASYITWRNWGEPEDRRYQVIRANNEPNFAAKSFYIVFMLQACVAWIVSMPLVGAMASLQTLNPIDVLGILLCLNGIAFETLGDYQLTRFKAKPENHDRVMNEGLWHYTRHPNYFGDFCVWWGFYLIAVGAGAWWTIAGPILMTLFLLKVSGVSLLEKDITERRPKYAEYVKTTSAFFPMPKTKFVTKPEVNA